MIKEPHYFDDPDAPTPEKDYRKFIEAHLNAATPNPKRPVLGTIKRAQNKFKGTTPKKVLRAQNDIADAIDSFLMLCERRGLNSSNISSRNIELACLGKDARFLPDELVALIIKHPDIKQAIGDLTAHITTQWNGIGHSRREQPHRRETNRMRRFYRRVAEAYWQKLEHIEESVDALGDASLDELRQMEGDLQKIAHAVERVATKVAKEIRSRDSKAGAEKSNKKHADRQTDVFSWLDEHYTTDQKHKDMAELIEKLVPREYDTILKDITAWKKMRKR